MRAAEMAFRPTVFDAYVAALGEARLGQASMKPDHAIGPLRLRHPMQHPDRRHRRLLGLACERRNKRASHRAQQEAAAIHYSIT